MKVKNEVKLGVTYKKRDQDSSGSDRFLVGEIVLDKFMPENNTYAYEGLFATSYISTQDLHRYYIIT